MRVVLDTSALITPIALSPDSETAVSSISFAELALGVETASDPVERAVRRTRLDRLRSALGPGLPFDDTAAGVYGTLTGIVAAAGRSPRRRALDLMIAATAVTHDAAIVTRNVDDFAGLERLVKVLGPR